MSLAARKLDTTNDADWLPVSTAAAMMAMNAGSLRRKCEVNFERLGLARKVDGQWLVSRQADPKLRRPVELHDRDLAQIAQLRGEGVSRDYIEIAEARRDIVRDFAAFRMKHRGRKLADIKALYVGELITSGVVGATRKVKKLKTRQLATFLSAYASGGIAALVPNWSGNQRKAESIGKAAFAQFMTFIRSGTSKKVRDAYKLTRGAALSEHPDDPEWAWPSYRTVLRAYQETPETERILHEEGPHRFRAKCLPKVARSYEDIPAGTHLCGDVRTLDFMARVPDGAGGWKRTRLKLTAWLDVRSRFLAGWCIKDEANSDTILSTFKSACETLETVPVEVTIDNGKDYRAVGGRANRHRKWDEFESKRVLSAFERLGIEVHYAIVRHPWSKIIEPWFTRVSELFDRWFPSYWGGRTDKRPWDAERWTREHVQQLPTELEVEEAFAECLAAIHEEQVNGDGMFGLCPRQALSQYFTTRPRPVHAEVLALTCCRMHGPVKVKRDGIRHDNIWYGKHDEEIWRRYGTEVWYLTDPVEADRITLCDEKGVPLCVAFADRNIGQSRSEVRAAQRMKRSAERTVKKYADARDNLIATPIQRIAKLRAAEAKSRQIADDDLPPTPLADALRIVRPEVAAAAGELERAAGGEAIRRLADMNAAASALNNGARPTHRILEYLASVDGDEQVQDERPARRIDIRELAGDAEGSFDE